MTTVIMFLVMAAGLQAYTALYLQGNFSKQVCNNPNSLLSQNCHMASLALLRQ